MPEFINLPRDSAVTSLSFNLIQKFVKTLSIEKFLKLLVKNIHLISKILIAISPAIDLAHQLLACFHIAWFCAPMKLVLKSVLDIIFQIFWNIISMGDVSDSCHWNWAHKLICETWQLGLQKSNDMQVT